MATAGGMLIAKTDLDHICAQKRKLGSENAANAVARFSHMLDMFFQEFAEETSANADSLADEHQSAYGANRISLLDAQLMSHQLRRMDEILNARLVNAKTVLESIGNSSCLEVPGRGGPNVWTKFTVTAETLARAKAMRKRLHRAGIETETMYTPLHLRTAGRQYSRGVLPITESIYPRTFNLPVRPGIQEAQMDYIAKIVHHVVS